MIKSKVLFICMTLLLFILSALALRHAHGIKEGKISSEIETLYLEREAIDSNLRAQIVALQKKIVNLPKIFSMNKREILVDMIHANFKVESTEKISEKVIVNQLYTRDQRKELYGGRIVVNLLNNQMFYSVGVTDEHGEYTGEVEKNLLQSNNAAADFEKLSAIVNADLSEESGKVNYEEKISILKQICIDGAFEAEQTRIEFVANERDVAKINNKFIEASQKHNREWLKTVLVVLAGNILLAVAFAVVIFRKSSTPGK